jgi:hypothetical protein
LDISKCGSCEIGKLRNWSVGDCKLGNYFKMDEVGKWGDWEIGNKNLEISKMVRSGNVELLKL